MLIIAILGGSLVPIGKIIGNIKTIIKNKILKVLIKTGIDNIEKVLIKALLGRMRNIDNNINNTNINKIAIARDFKKEVNI